MIFKIFLVILGLSGNFYSSCISSKTIPEFVEFYPETKVIKCTKNYTFSYSPCPLSYLYTEAQYPHQGVFRDISILEIKNGIGFVARVSSYHNIPYFFVNNILLKERNVYPLDPMQGQKYIKGFDLEEVLKVNGRVAVINCIWVENYGHYVIHILSYLALLEIYNVQYDYLWIPYEFDYMKEILEIWGIDSSKIIPIKINQPIEADTLIVPTAIGQHDLTVRPYGDYIQDFLLLHIRKKLLEGVKKLPASIKDYPKKIFVSRNDSILNK